MKEKTKVYIIAEVGINHNGLLENCYRLIDQAKTAGCDCVKFQFFTAKNLYPRSAGKLDWNNGAKRYKYDIYKAVQTFELPKSWIKSLINYCNRKKIDFLSSVFDKKGLKYLMQQGMKMIKIPSYSITNLPLIEACASYRVPIIMSTGGATLGEIEEAVNVINKYHKKLSLMHCSIQYPTEIKNCNLGIIETLKYAFSENKIGYSDHTQTIVSAVTQAVYLGAEIIEKHITLDKKMSGPDHFFALDFGELKNMVRDIRQAEKKCLTDIQINKKIYGSSRKEVFEHEKYLRDFCFTRLFAARNIKKGEFIRCKDLSLLRPGNKKRGLEPKYLRLFANNLVRAKKDILVESSIDWTSIL